MKIKRFASVWQALACVLLVIPASAADIKDCEAALRLSNVQFKSNDALRLSYLETIDETRFEEIKKGADTGASYGFISGFGKFTDFRTAVETERRGYNLQYSKENS